MAAEHIVTKSKNYRKKENDIMKKSKKTLIMMLLLSAFVMSPVRGQAKTINMGRFTLTAFCPCYECSEGFGRKCAMKGHYATSDHTVAVDEYLINLGDKLLINGKEYVAEDTGGAVNGEKIDIFFDTHEEVEEFGVRYGDVKIIR